MTDLDTYRYRYRGPIDTSYSGKVVSSGRAAYFCEQCAQSIDVPNGTDLCNACLRDERSKAA